MNTLIKNKRIYWISLSVLVIWILSGSGIEKYWLEYEMKQLCAKDGGVRVYELVALPPEMFSEHGDPFPAFQGKLPEGRLGSDYRYIRESTFLNKGHPSQFVSDGVLRRSTEKIIRVSDGKLLGESIVYGRTGGETILLWHPSGNGCPIYKNKSETLLGSVFIKRKN